MIAGASGFVQLAVDLQMEQEVAIKFVQKGSDYLQYAADREILNHRLLGGHAHIVQLKEVHLSTFHDTYTSAVVQPAAMAP
jgi:serine/threonine protein kinase